MKLGGVGDKQGATGRLHTAVWSVGVQAEGERWDRTHDWGEAGGEDKQGMRCRCDMVGNGRNQPRMVTGGFEQRSPTLRGRDYSVRRQVSVLDCANQDRFTAAGVSLTSPQVRVAACTGLRRRGGRTSVRASCMCASIVT